MTRDMETNPYSRDEQRVADWIVEHTKGALGGGDDPIGFLLSSYQYLTSLYQESLREEDKS